MLEELELGVAHVLGVRGGAGVGELLAAVDGDWGEQDGAVGREGVGAVLELEDGFGAGGGRC